MAEGASVFHDIVIWSLFESIDFDSADTWNMMCLNEIQLLNEIGIRSYRYIFIKIHDLAVPHFVSVNYLTYIIYFK